MMLTSVVLAMAVGCSTPRRDLTSLTVPEWVHSESEFQEMLAEVEASNGGTIRLLPDRLLETSTPRSVTLRLSDDSSGLSARRTGPRTYEIIVGNDYVGYVARGAEADFFHAEPAEYDPPDSGDQDTSWRSTEFGRRWMAAGLRFKARYSYRFGVAHEYAHAALGHLEPENARAGLNPATRKQLELEADQYPNGEDQHVRVDPQ